MWIDHNIDSPEMKIAEKGTNFRWKQRNGMKTGRKLEAGTE